jgi:CRISPR-associated protein Csb2
MLRIALHFLAGRYHATPWGRHVNEGAIEWPPSPWRVGRALIATGFAKAGWTAIPETAAHLIVRLASTPPIYHLPPTTAAHTRHYMPTSKGTSTKVLDAFAHPGRASEMIIEWDLDAGDEELALLDVLVRRMSYLGRAESWIEAQRVDSVPRALSRCAPGDAPPGPDWERIELLALMPAAEYPAWRARTHQRETERRIERKRERARELGKRRPRALSKAALARLDAELPATAVDALCADTAALHRAGWSQPPGSRWLAYWRPGDALDTCPITPRSVARRASTPPRVAVLALDAGRASRLPSMRDALPRCEALHRALVKHSAELAGEPAPCFTGRDGQRKPLQGHIHATLMPLVLDHPLRERMDHIVLFAPMGLDAHAVAVLHGLTLGYGEHAPRLGVRLAGLGQPAELADRIPAFRAGRVWESCTPFVPPRHLKASGKNSLVGQVCAELTGRGLPEPMAVQIEVDTPEGIRYLDCAKFWQVWRGRQGGDGMRLPDRWRMFRRVRQGDAPKPPIDVAFGLRLIFAEPVQGPINLGYASHFGLGQFVPSSGQHTIAHLPRRKRGTLARITEVIHDAAMVEMIILYGSHARGDWVEDPGSGYMSDLDILVLVTSAELAADDERWFDCQERAWSASEETPVSILVHTAEDVHHKVEQGNSFFRDVLIEGIALYDSGRVELPAIKALTPAQRLTLARVAFPSYFHMARQYYEGFQDARNHARDRIAAFYLQQAAETLYKAVLLTFAGYLPKMHDLAALDRMSTHAAPDLGSLIPTDTPDRKRLGRLLSSGYVEARYNPAFTIARADLDALARHVRAFHDRAEHACRTRLAELTSELRGTNGR